jgi:shikimate dehydrogenase
MNVDAPLRYAGGALVDATGAPSAWPRLALLGHPVSHSLSPRLHRAALRLRGIEGDYRTVDVEPGELGACLEAALEAGVEGINLTVPHKVSVLERISRVSEECRTIGAANTLVARDGEWTAHNTDARGLALALEMARGRALPRTVRRVSVIGAGGAARAAVQAMAALGSGELRVLARDPGRAGWVRAVGAELLELRAQSLRGSTLLLQCTPLGLHPERDPSPVSLAEVDADCFAMDLTYADAPSAFLREAAARGCETENGLPMLVAQAGLAFSMWFGTLPPLDAMRAALRD